MKKIISLSILLILLCLPFKIMAADFTTSMGSTKNINPNAEFTVTFSAGNATNLMGIVGKLTYDKAKLSIISSSGLSGFNLTLGSNIVVDNTVGKSGAFSFTSITFKALSGFVSGQSTTITFTNVTGSNGVADISGSNSSLTVNVLTPKSTNNNLSSLKVNGVAVSNFSASKTSYTVTVNNNISSAAITATPADNKSTISGTGTKNLSVYTNTYKIVVTAESGSKKTYTLTIIRKDLEGRTVPLSTNNNLKSLTVTGYDIKFNPNTTSYSLEVENNIGSLSIEAIGEDSKSTVVVDKSDDLKIGNNVIKVVVTAEDGSKKEYVLNIRRKNEGPTTTLGELLNIINQTPSSIINIDINDDKTILNEEVVKAIKSNNKQVIINQYQNDKILYKWEFDGTKVNDSTSIDTLISFRSDNTKVIGSLTNYADNLYLHFNYSGQLPESTFVSVNVADKYQEGDVVNLYYFDDSNQKVTMVYDNLVVTGGYIRFKLEHCSDYILSMADYSAKSNVLIYQIIIGILVVIVLSLAGKNMYQKRDTSNGI